MLIQRERGHRFEGGRKWEARTSSQIPSPRLLRICRCSENGAPDSLRLSCRFPHRVTFKSPLQGAMPLGYTLLYLLKSAYPKQSQQLPKATADRNPWSWSQIKKCLLVNVELLSLTLVFTCLSKTPHFYAGITKLGNPELINPPRAQMTCHYAVLLPMFHDPHM